MFSLTDKDGQTRITISVQDRLPVDPLSREGTGSSIEIRIPIFGTRFDLISCLTDVIFQPFPDLIPETVRKQKKGG